MSQAARSGRACKRASMRAPIHAVIEISVRLQHSYYDIIPDMPTKKSALLTRGARAGVSTSACVLAFLFDYRAKLMRLSVQRLGKQRLPTPTPLATLDPNALLPENTTAPGSTPLPTRTHQAYQHPHAYSNPACNENAYAVTDFRHPNTYGNQHGHLDAFRVTHAP